MPTTNRQERLTETVCRWVLRTADSIAAGMPEKPDNPGLARADRVLRLGNEEEDHGALQRRGDGHWPGPIPGCYR
jgi:hypothetical protein